MTCMIAIFTALRMSLALASEGSHQWSKEGMWGQEGYAHSVRPALRYFLGVEVMSLFFLIGKYQSLPLYSTTMAGKTNTMASKSSMLIFAKKGKGKKRRSRRRSKEAGKNLRTTAAYALKWPRLITSFKQMITSNIQVIHKVCFCLLFTHQLESPSNWFLPINAPGQDSQKPTLAADAFKGLDCLKDRLAADSTAPTGGSESQPTEAGSKSYCNQIWIGLILVILWIIHDWVTI